jgi:hypothetical protein
MNALAIMMFYGTALYGPTCPWWVAYYYLENKA